MAAPSVSCRARRTPATVDYLNRSPSLTYALLRLFLLTICFVYLAIAMSPDEPAAVVESREEKKKRIESLMPPSRPDKVMQSRASTAGMLK